MSEVENGYTFRMGDHEMTMRDSFASMLDSRQLTDCVLVCPHLQTNQSTDESNATETRTDTPLTNGHSSGDGPKSTISRTQIQNNRMIRTHRVILSASSDFFRSIFSSVSTLNTGVIAVIVTNVDFEDLESIIEFIYKGQVSVGQSRIHKFLAAAQLLMVKGLMNIKLVSGDNQPIDETTNGGNDAEISRIRNEKRLLEQELKVLKESDRNKSEKSRKEIEEELRKKLETEKNSLNEAKKRFEAEKMKFIIEKETFEKSKVREIYNKSQTESSVTKVVEISESSKTDISITDNNRTDISISDKQIIKSSPITSQSNRTLGSQISVTAQKPIESLPPKKVNNNTDTESINETEGRQLRKRLKVNDDNQDSAVDLNRSGVATQDDDDDDGEVYEVDFSQLVPQQTGVGEARQRFSAALVSGNTSIEKTSTPKPTTSSSNANSRAAVMASTLASFNATQVTPSQTRTLRRSTSSHGSASTQSMPENGNELSSADAANQRMARRGPGRTPNWMKDQEEGNDSIESNPDTRARRQRNSTDQSPQAREGLYSCPYCPQVYHGNQSMQDHINGIHLNSKQQYICDFCGKVYTWRISLNKHLKTVHPDQHID